MIKDLGEYFFKNNNYYEEVEGSFLFLY